MRIFAPQLGSKAAVAGKSSTMLTMRFANFWNSGTAKSIAKQNNAADLFSGSAAIPLGFFEPSSAVHLKSVMRLDFTDCHLKRRAFTMSVKVV